MTPKLRIIARSFVLVLLCVWVSFVCWVSYTDYRREINLPPSQYSDIDAQPGVVELTEAAHTTAAADKFYVDIIVRCVPVSLIGLSLFWILGASSSRGGKELKS
jgi:hypothetical protein